LQEEELAGAFVGVDLGRKRRGVRELQGDVALPPWFQRGHVDDDPAPRVRRFAETDHQHVARHAEVFHGSRQREAVGWDDADVGLAVDEAVGGEILGIDDGVVDIGEDLELVGDPRVVAVGGQPVADAALPALALDERLDHARRQRLAADPPVGKNRHLALRQPRI
jgi:hypothetical protein